MMRKLIKWFFGDDEIEDDLDGVDDPHDNVDPQRVTYRYGGGDEEGGKWL